MGARVLAVVLLLGGSAVAASSQAEGPAVNELMARVAAYAANYGEKASLLVAVEKYFQQVGSTRPRQLVAEFALVKTPAGWVGYRDVVEVDGKQVSDRRDRLLKLLTDPSADASLARAVSEESARYNIGPISRTFNVPTSVMQLFLPLNLSRFRFTLKGDERIDGVTTREVVFKELATPTLTMTRAGRDVPMEGSLWVVPKDGAVVRTQLRMRNFADAATTDARGGTGRIDSSADFNVIYSWHAEFGLWLPREMTEQYAGPIRGDDGRGYVVRARTNATYSAFKRFETGAKMIVPQ